jgi:cytochrome c oxidase subunit IV
MGDHSHDQHHEHKHTSQLGYLMVLLVLFAGTIITYKARDIGHAQHWSLGFSAFVALLIASIKASVVVYFFMHVRESPKIIAMCAVGGFLWLSLLFIFTFGDYLTRRELPAGRSWQRHESHLAEGSQSLEGPLHTDQFGKFSVLAHSIKPDHPKAAKPAALEPKGAAPAHP